MAAPEYVPALLSEQPRQPLRMPAPRRWTPDRPGDLAGGQPRGPAMGAQGPDQGYAFLLAERFRPRLRVAAGELVDDAIAGCGAVALRRASLLGRAPVTGDLELAFRLWGFFEGAPRDLVEFRCPRFTGAAHHYWKQRAIADAVPEATVRLTPSQVADRLSAWRELLAV